MTGPMAKGCYCGTCATCRGTARRPVVADPVAFRHGAIKHRMLTRIGSTEVDGSRPLNALGTRDDDDPAIALIDAFAGSMHILAWNVARLADDATIRRTEDRDALVDLTRLLGYEPRPALAATTTLSFTLLDLEGTPKAAKIPKGTKVASVPGQDEKPQTFETDAELDARAEWNLLKPVLAKKVPRVDAATTSITIAGTASTVKTGDLVLVYLEPRTAGNWLCARVRNIVRESNPENQPPQTRIELASGVILPALTSQQQGNAFRNCVIVLGQRAAAFGATAPDIRLMSKTIQIHGTPAGAPTEWSGLQMPAPGIVDLDAVYADAIAGRFILFTRTENVQVNEIGRIAGVAEIGRHDFGLSAKVSRVSVEGVDTSQAGFQLKVRETAIYIETAREQLLVLDDDVEMPAAGVAPDRIIVRGKLSLPVGRRIVLSGEQWIPPHVARPKIGEVVTLRSSSLVGNDTELVLERTIVNRFHSTTLSLLANSVGASHGETPVNGAELIGSGNAASPSPRFQLKGSPLAYVPAPNPRGYAPAIEVRVGERLYAEKPTIFGLGSEDRAYTVKTVREGKSDVQFAGRLPSGTHNVTALYRVGGGTAGNLDAGRLTTPMSPVIGVAGVSNPVPAEGASDAETLDDMRSAAPQSIRTLDRVVSLADFEAFAKSYRGIGKAIATELHVGMRTVVCLTIATTGLTSPTAGSDVIESLRAALATVMPPGRGLRIEGFTDLTANVTIALAIDPAFRRADVEAAVRATLASSFGRAARNFAEALHRSVILATVHKVEGVIAATLQVFVLTAAGSPPESEGRLFCPGPSMVNGLFSKAGLLSIDPAQIQFTEMQP